MSPPRLAARMTPSLIFVAVLTLPAMQTLFQFAPTRPLAGVVDKGPEPAPRTLHGWHSGALQAEWEHDLVQGLGLRDWMVRLDNQLKYSLFRVTKRPVIAGRDGWMYEAAYLTSHTHLSEENGLQILEKVKQLWLAQQVLRENGITMLLLVTPSKVETLPEHLSFPHRQEQAAGYPRDIDLLEAMLDVGCIDHLDAQRLFWQWRTSDPAFPLFPRTGVHWGMMSSARIAALVLERLGQLSRSDLPDIEIASVRTGAAAEMGQADLFDLANLLQEDGLEEPIPMPQVMLRPGDQGRPAGIMVVSSSFGWLLAEHLSNPAIARPLSLLYYFKSRHDWIDGVQQPGRDFDSTPAALRKALLEYRFVIVECNVTHIRQLGFGFPAAVLAAFGMPRETSLPPLPPARLKVIDDVMHGHRLPH